MLERRRLGDKLSAGRSNRWLDEWLARSRRTYIQPSTIIALRNNRSAAREVPARRMTARVYAGGSPRRKTRMTLATVAPTEIRKRLMKQVTQRPDLYVTGRNCGGNHVIRTTATAVQAR